MSSKLSTETLFAEGRKEGVRKTEGLRGVDIFWEGEATGVAGGGTMSCTLIPYN